MECFMWGICNSLVIMGLLFGTMTGMSIKTEEIKEKMHSYRFHIFKAKKDTKGNVKYPKDEKRFNYDNVKIVIKEKINLNISFGMSMVGTVLLMLFNFKKPGKIETRAFILFMCCIFAFFIGILLKFLLFKYENKKVKNDIRKNPEKYIPEDSIINMASNEEND